jgi:hypothetical protein
MQLCMRLRLHDKASVALNDFGVLCVDPYPPNSYVVLSIIVLLQVSVMAGLWATKTGFFTYLFILVFRAPNYFY